MAKKNRSVRSSNNYLLFIAIGILIVSIVGFLVLNNSSNIIGRGFWVGNTPDSSSGLVYAGSVNLKAGWTMVHGLYNPSTVSPSVAAQSSESGQISDPALSSHIKAVYLFSPKSNRGAGAYIKLFPNDNPADVEAYNALASNYGVDYQQKLLSDTSLWVYSDISQSYSYNLKQSPSSLEDRALYTGWNFVSVTPDFFPDNSATYPTPQFFWREVQGGCTITRLYYFNTKSNAWISLTIDTPVDYSDVLYKGFAVKVSNDCSLGKVLIGDPTSVPAIPEDDYSSASGGGGSSGSGSTQPYYISKSSFMYIGSKYFKVDSVDSSGTGAVLRVSDSSALDASFESVSVSAGGTIYTVGGVSFVVDSIYYYPATDTTSDGSWVQIHLTSIGSTA